MIQFRVPTITDPLRVLALGAGVQSSFLFLASCLGQLPRLDAAVFADTMYEPSAVYEHLAWLAEFGLAHGVPIIKCSVGDLRKEAIDFRVNRASDDGKRHASVPFYVKNRDGSRGQIRRQCTTTYKIEPMERVIREQMLSLRRGQRSRDEVLVEQWIGISSDESGRCAFPGVWIARTIRGRDLFGDEYIAEKKYRWRGVRWKCHDYPLCGVSYRNDRTVQHRDEFLAGVKLTGKHGMPSGATMTRGMCEYWLKRYFPDRKIPRSACIGCPYRSNAEWRRMRDEDPQAWLDAVEFDRQIRVADAEGQSKRKKLVGLPFVHDSLIPLDLVDLDQDDGKTGAGCGIIFDKSGMQDGPLLAGMCGH